MYEIYTYIVNYTMAKSFAYDERLPVSEHTSKDDPNHPKNLFRNMAILTAQAHADTKYDIVPPPRVVAEGFTLQYPSPMNFKFIIICVSIVSLITVILYSPFQILRIVCIALLLASIHYALYILEKQTE